MNQRGFVLPSPMMLVGGVALAFALSTLLFYRLYQGAVDDFANFKSAVEAEQNAIKAENEQKLAAMAAVNAHAEKGWADARRELDRRGRIRVQPVRCSGEMPRLSTAVEGLNAATLELRPDPTISVAECETRVNNAVNDAAQVVHLQAWIQRQHEASKPHE